jgi:hypothetical protein
MRRFFPRTQVLPVTVSIPPPQFLSPSCAAFFGHWRALAGAGLVPTTEDFLDHAPLDLMPYVYIHDLTEAGLLVRFMGTGLARRWRHDLTGTLFGEHLSASDRARLIETARLIVTQPCAMRQLGRIGSSAGRAVPFEAVAVPLAVRPGRPARLMIFSQILDDLSGEEHSRSFDESGAKDWLDLGAGVPPVPPP